MCVDPLDLGYGARYDPDTRAFLYSEWSCAGCCTVCRTQCPRSCYQGNWTPDWHVSITASNQFSSRTMRSGLHPLVPTGSRCLARLIRGCILVGCLIVVLMLPVLSISYSVWCLVVLGVVVLPSKTIFNKEPNCRWIVCGETCTDRFLLLNCQKSYFFPHWCMKRYWRQEGYPRSYY